MEYNIEMDLDEVGCARMDWTGLAQDREKWRAVVNAVMNLSVSFLQDFPPKPCMQLSVYRTYYITRPSHSSGFDHPNDIW